MSDEANFEDRVEIARETFAALIAGDPWISAAPAIPVVTEKKGDIAAMIAEALNRLGLCIVVVAADGDELRRTGDTLSLRVRFVAQVSEKPLLSQAAAKAANIRHRPALSAAVRAMKAVDLQPNGLDAGMHLRGLNEFALLTDRPFELVKTPRDVVYEVSATTYIEL